MPKISLVVCLFQERDFLERLLKETRDLVDDLVVVHDGPEDASVSPASSVPAIDYAELPPEAPLPNEYRMSTSPPTTGSIHELVLSHGGRFFVGPRCFQQEPHWPFAWWQARHDWILRLDADEFPSKELRRWLQSFREMPKEPAVSGYLCLWPMWNGEKEVTHSWPGARNFLFHRNRVRFFGMVEQVPLPDDDWEALPLKLCHRPRRKSYGLGNILFRRQGSEWRRVIAESLLRTPSQLSRWRWSDEGWPYFWQSLREAPVKAGFYFLARNSILAVRDIWKAEGRFKPAMAFATPLHHLLLALRLRRLQRERIKP